MSLASPAGLGRRALLAAIRGIHSAVFLVMLSAILWLLRTGIEGRRDRSAAAAATLVTVEAAVFVANGGVCPLTPLAERYGASRGGVSDIFLPDVVARTIPIWSTALIAVGALLHLARFAADRRRAAAPTRPAGLHTRYSHGPRPVIPGASTGGQSIA